MRAGCRTVSLWRGGGWGGSVQAPAKLRTLELPNFRTSWRLRASVREKQQPSTKATKLPTKLATKWVCVCPLSMRAHRAPLSIAYYGGVGELRLLTPAPL